MYLFNFEKTLLQSEGKLRLFLRLLSIFVTFLFAWSCQTAQEQRTKRENPNETANPSQKQSDLNSGVRDGNGGYVVVCEEKNARLGDEKVATYDVYAALEKGIKPIFDDDSKDYREIAKSMIDQFKIVDSDRHQLYTRWLEEFPDDMLLSPNLGLPRVPDPGALELPPGCSDEIAAYHQPPLEKGEKRYFVEEKLWQAMSPFNKAALVVHEIIYREAKSQGHSLSLKIRAFMGYIIAGSLPKDRAAYELLVKSIIDLKYQNSLTNIKLVPETVEKYDSGEIRRGRMAEGIVTNPPGYEDQIIEGTWLDFNKEGIIIAIESEYGSIDVVQRSENCPHKNQTNTLYAKRVEFYFHNYVKRVVSAVYNPAIQSCFQDEERWHGPNDKGFRVLTTDPILEFYPNGVWKGGKVSAGDVDSWFFYPMPNGKDIVEVTGTVSFYENGELKKGTLNKSANFISSETDGIVKVKKGQTIELDKSGKLIRVGDL